jgi:hypothetical protein
MPSRSIPRAGLPADARRLRTDPQSCSTLAWPGPDFDLAWEKDGTIFVVEVTVNHGPRGNGDGCRWPRR